VSFGQTERIKLGAGDAVTSPNVVVTVVAALRVVGVYLAVRINNSMQSAVGQFCLDQCRERINIWSMYVSNEVIFPFKNTPKFLVVLLNYECCRGSSVSIVSGYGLDDRAIEVRSPAEVK
jgi:hypothetical protein